jgi:hypothetical protein
MLILSAKARRVIDAAVEWYCNVPQQEKWGAWSVAHPTPIGYGVMVETPDPTSIPTDVADIILAALEDDLIDLDRMRQAGCTSEDDVCDLDNDITYRNLIKRNIHQAKLSDYY